MINFKKIFRRRKNITKAGTKLTDNDYYLEALTKSYHAGQISRDEYRRRLDRAKKQ